MTIAYATPKLVPLKERSAIVLFVIIILIEMDFIRMQIKIIDFLLMSFMC
jgi:hypothetical protein